MPVILIDANIEGQGALLKMRMQTLEWRDLSAALDVSVQSFLEVGLDPASPDDVVWRFCQAHGYYLLTSNRNQDSEQSLEATLRRERTPTSLPVFTLSLPDRVYHSPTFLDQVVEKLLSYVLDADNIRGTGRLYLPWNLMCLEKRAHCISAGTTPDVTTATIPSQLDSRHFHPLASGIR